MFSPSFTYRCLDTNENQRKIACEQELLYQNRDILEKVQIN